MAAGQREAHGGEPVRDQELPRLHRLPVLGGLEHVGAGVDRRDGPGGGQLAGDLDHPVRRQPRHADLERALPLAAQPVHLDHVPVGVVLVEPRRQLLEDGAEVAHHLERRSEVAPASDSGERGRAGRTPHEAQHGRGVAGAARDQLDRVEAEGDDEVGATDHGLLEHAAREHAHRQRVRIGQRALGLVGGQDGRGQRLGKGAQPLRVGGAALKPRQDHGTLGLPDHAPRRCRDRRRPAVAAARASPSPRTARQAGPQRPPAGRDARGLSAPSSRAGRHGRPSGRPTPP